MNRHITPSAPRRWLFVLLALPRFWVRAEAAITTSSPAPSVTPSPGASLSTRGAGGGGDAGGEAVQSSSSSGASWSASILDQASKNRDPYVAASPLSVAAVCRDGIALVSLHYNIDQERLTSHVADRDEAGSKSSLDLISADSESVEHNESEERLSSLAKFCDLPLSSRGPFRIEPIYENQNGPTSPPPMALLTAGWRTDGMVLADAARELIMEEVRLYCLPSLATVEDDRYVQSDEVGRRGNESGHDQEKRLLLNEKQSRIVVKDDDALGSTMMRQQHSYHGRRIAEGLSYYLAKCTFSEGVRTLSCVGLLACGGRRQHINGESRNIGGSLYLVDSTGTYRVRAHAIGNGSDVLHKSLVFVDFETLDCLDGLRTLLRIIAEEGGLVSPTRLLGDELLNETLGSTGNSGDDSNTGSSVMAKPAFVGSEVQNPSRKWIVPSNTAVELAVLRSGTNKMRRIRLPSLVDNI